MTKVLWILTVCVVISLVIIYQFLPLRRPSLKRQQQHQQQQQGQQQHPSAWDDRRKPNSTLILRRTPWSESSTKEWRAPTIPDAFLIDESDYCRRHPDLFILAYVHATINETAKRMLTRETWAKAGQYDDKVRVGVVFMVGRTKSLEEERILREESLVYRDIVQGNYSDSYHTLSYKALASLVWVDSHCSEVPWTLHADDDVLLDLFLLTKFLKTVDWEDSFLCYTWKGSAVRRQGRWLVHPEEFPGREYPTYCSGAVWILATRLIHRLLNAARQVPFLWVDDVYITGVLAKQAGIGHFKYLREYITKDSIDETDIGQKIAWVHIPDRAFWWQRILTNYGYPLDDYGF